MGSIPMGGAVVRGSIAYRLAGNALTRRLRFDYYLAQSDADRCPVILVNPISGGHYELEQAVARDLARHGHHAIVLFRAPCGEADWLGGDFQALEDELRSCVAARRRLVDWFETRGEIDTARIGVHGTSLGGMLSVLHAAADRRIGATVIFMAGGDLAELLWRSVEPVLRHFARAHGVLPDASDEDLAEFRKRARATLMTPAGSPNTSTRSRSSWRSPGGTRASRAISSGDCIARSGSLKRFRCRPGTTAPRSTSQSSRPRRGRFLLGSLLPRRQLGDELDRP